MSAAGERSDQGLVDRRVLEAHGADELHRQQLVEALDLRGALAEGEVIVQMVGIRYECNVRDLRSGFLEQLQTLRAEFIVKKGHTCRIAFGPTKARDEA